MSCWNWFMAAMCNRAGEVHTAMLLHLLEAGNVEGFLSYLEMYTWDEYTLLPCLHVCLLKKSWLCAEALLNSGARCDLRSVDLLSENIAQSADDEMLDVLRASVRSGLAVRHCTSLLLSASASGCADVVRCLLDLGADPNGRLAAGPYGNRTGLMASTRSGHDAVSTLFLDHPDTDVTVCDESGTTAVHVAVECCRHELLPAYVRRRPSALEQRDAQSSTPLLAAILRGCRDCAAILVENGADLNSGGQSASGAFGVTPLMLSIARRAGGITDLLVRHPRCDVDVADATTGMTALHRAADVGDVRAVRMLLERGAAANPVDRDAATPLLLAVNERHVDVAVELLPYVGCPDPTGTILKMALERGLLLLLEPLIYLGARLIAFFYSNDSKQFVNALFDWEPVVARPKSLKHQVMLLIRRTLKTVTEAKVGSLKLPSQLTEFILVRKWLARLLNKKPLSC